MENEEPDPPAPDDAEAIEVFIDLERVRRRPEMYIGDVDSTGLHRIVFELAVSVLAEVSAGYGRSLQVALYADGSVEVADGGRGVNPASHLIPGQPFLETALTQFFAGHHSGRDWMPYAIANTLSEWLIVETRHAGQASWQKFQRGRRVAAQRVSPCSGSGVSVTLKPDPTIFTDPRFSFPLIRDRLRQYAFLHSGMRISVVDEVTGVSERFEFEDGMTAFVQMLNKDRRPLHPEVLVVRGEQEGVRYEVGLQWCQEQDEIMRSFANDEWTGSGGTHVTGLRDAVTRSLRSFIRASGLPGVRGLKGEQARRGLTAVVSVRMARPLFSGSTKERLSSVEAQPAVRAGVSSALRRFFETNPVAAEAVARAATGKG